MELDRIKAKVRTLSNQEGVDVQIAWDTFFFEGFLRRLSCSPYVKDFVLKGGFFLQSVIGVSARSTMDIDFKFIGKGVPDDELIACFKEICEIENGDGIQLDILGIEEIRAETKYGGKTIKISAKFFNVRKTFGVDVGFGDVVTPCPIEHVFPSSFGGDGYRLLTYPIETALAEKLETLISKGTNNSRIKDLVDMYLYASQGFDPLTFVAATVNTFWLRGTPYDRATIFETAKKVFGSERIRELFDHYKNKHPFASGITFEMCKEAVDSLLSNLFFPEKVRLADYGVILHLVRHGQDDTERVGGWSDNRLTPAGIDEIKYLRREIDDSYGLFVSSDLERTKETSDILNVKLHMDIHYSESFREVNNGVLRNMLKRDFQIQYPGRYFSTLGMDESYPGGETPRQFFLRVEAAFLSLLQANRGKKILLVTHGGVITVILCLLRGFPYSNKLKIAPSTGTLTKLN
ncbi:MAG: histidine phosphatase family protein [Bacilli bacterium]|nr:histidine phosphatase family protein [Bacilli bacterium]